ncbi:MAG: hypothetical protein IJJ81_02485 [Ruminococcus sp.]|uniref:hypothetical protein n=1 Tax=Ruminococcus flavefaciens TaxID=1265 RepID=UPI0026EB1081|nr:hypothetical protein [Ruminococcus flavefaciens]MBR0511426.1 hypothetical protein [Ruminococcus sp.]
MKISWKRTLIWLAAALALLFIPFGFFFGVYAAMVFICYLAASVVTTVKKDAKPYIPYSIAAVVQALLVSMICSAEIDYSESSLFLAAGSVMIILFYVPFLMIMAAVVYCSGKKAYTVQNEGGHNNE